MISTRWILTTLAGLALVLAGCSEQSAPDEPPEGWEATETRMWEQGVDTSDVFRDLDDLSTMGIVEADFALSSGTISEDQFQKAIKRSLLEFYRTNPVIVDSLFEEYAVPKLEGANLSDAVEDDQLKPELLGKFQKSAFKAVNDHYRQPQLNEGVSGISYPDSLRQNDVSGDVRLQLHVDTSGSVNAVEVIEGVHPTLDAIAMKAGTQTTWEPAYVRQGAGEEWKPHRGWARTPVPFRMP